MSEKAGAIVTRDEARVLRAFGEEVIIHLGAAQTGGKLTVWTEITPPGGGPPPHYHTNDDESFHVLEGRVEFFADGQWHEVAPGGTIFMPRGAVHGFRNVGTTPSRMLLSTTPSGVEVFFARCADEFAKPGGPDMPRVMEISAEHGIHFVPA
jgi:quercetin dioxygenase-like cupin family protein